MQTKREPESKPNANQILSQHGQKRAKDWVPPRGIRYSFRPDRPNAPFYLHWRKDGKVTAHGYADEKSRENEARKLAGARREHGNSVLSFDPVLWRKYREFQEIVGDGVDPILVAHEWRKAQQGTPRAESKTVECAVVEYLRLRDEEKGLGADTRRHVGRQLTRFRAALGAMRLNEVGADDVRGWLRNLKDNDGKKLGPHAVNDHRKNVKLFFKYALQERWGALENPCEHIRPPKREDGDPVVISLRDAFEFFKANRDERAIGRAALEAFAGVRYTTAGLISKDAINFERRGIRMAASIHKSGRKDGRSRYRQGHPGNLWEWLRHMPETAWSMSALNYREEKRYAWIRAGLRPAANASDGDGEKIRALRNIWRHSFVSCHLAAFRNVPLTQYLAQHSNPQMTEDYEGMADHEEALRYFMIAPETVKLPWEEFMKLPVMAAK